MEVTFHYPYQACGNKYEYQNIDDDDTQSMTSGFAFGFFCRCYFYIPCLLFVVFFFTFFVGRTVVFYLAPVVSLTCTVSFHSSFSYVSCKASSIVFAPC